MAVRVPSRRRTVLLCSIVVATVAVGVAGTQQPLPRFGGAYSGLDARRQGLVEQWVARFTQVTGQKLEAGPFYDDIISLSGKTTFDAVTHALMTARGDRAARQHHRNW